MTPDACYPSSVDPARYRGDGWREMTADELLAFHASTLKVPLRGFGTFDDGGRFSEDAGIDVAIFGVSRVAEEFPAFIFAAKLIPAGDAFAENVRALSFLAEEMAMPFDASDESVVHLGFMLQDCDAIDRATPESVVKLASASEDEMAAFIAAARDQGLLGGIKIFVREPEPANFD